MGVSRLAGEYGEYIFKFSKKFRDFPLRPTLKKYSTSFEKFSWSIFRKSLRVYYRATVKATGHRKMIKNGPMILSSRGTCH